MKLLGLFFWVWSGCSLLVDAQNNCPTEPNCLGCQSNRGRRIICSSGGLTAFPNLPPSIQQNVEELTLRNNELTNVGMEDLVNYTRLETLNLSFNNISNIEPGSFNETRSLREIDLTSNQVSELPDEVFANTELTSLILMDNVIETISAATFKGLQDFSTINLDNNQIQTIPIGTFGDIGRIDQLILTNNPLVCDCRLRWLPEFVNSTNPNHPLSSTLGICAVPAQNLTGVPVDTLVTEDFECECDPPCINGTCNTEIGVCGCNEGFIGTACDTACPAGSYGTGCIQNCTCVPEQESSPCGHVDGTCHCLPGYNGSSCELECLDSYYGQDCANDCQCENEALCDFRTGSCDCTAGWMGQFCNTSCVNGTYGPNCQQVCMCSPDHESSPCDRIDGTCYCEPGYTGKFCDIMGGSMETPTQSNHAAIIAGATVGSVVILLLLITVAAVAIQILVIHVHKTKDVKLRISPSQQFENQTQLQTVNCNKTLAPPDEHIPAAESEVAMETATDVEMMKRPLP